MEKKKEHIYKFEYNFMTIQVFCFLLTILFAAITFCVYLFLECDFFYNPSVIDEFLVYDSIFIFFVIMCLWLVLHEVIHGISYVINGADYKNIKYGVVLEKGILYCKCGEYVNKKNILWSVINPFIYIGIITLIISFIIGSATLLILSIINISGACADILMFLFFLKRDKDLKFREIKDSSTFILKTTEDLSNKKFFAVKLVEELDEELEEENDKLITISKPSKWIMIFILVLFVISFII